MAAPYTPTAIVNYNANPPPDDGSQVAQNRLTWAKHKTKIGDPLKTHAETNFSAIETAFAKLIGGNGITSTAISYDIQSTDQGKLVVATASGITIKTPDATDVDDPFVYGVLNNSSGDITLDGFDSQTVNGSPTLTMKAGDGWLVFTDGTNHFVIGRKIGVLPRGYIDGCILANNGSDATNDINISAGVCRDSTNAVDITCAAMTKQLDANWVAGTNQGFRNSAVGIANTTYHIYAVAKADGTQDYYAHTSLTVATVLTALQAETGGSGYIYARHIMSIVRISNAIVLFTQIGDYVRMKAPNADISAATVNTTRANEVLDTVPTGMPLRVALKGAITGTDRYIIVSCPDDTDQAPSSTNSNVRNASGTQDYFYLEQYTNTSAEIALRSDAGSTVVSMFTLGYWHQRGKDA